MAIALLQFFASALVIVVAGSFLTRFADKIADITGWGKMFVGSLLLAGATSIPELTVDLKAIELDLPNLAVGDLLGSSLFNLLILATLDFVFPSAFRHTAFSPKFLHHSLAAVLTIILTAIIGIALVAKIELSFLSVNFLAWAVLFVYLYGLRLIFLDGNHVMTHQQNVSDQKQSSVLPPFIGYLTAAAVIAITAPYLVGAADNIARLSGLGHTFVGTTLMALATSLPELIATLAAFRIGSPDLALGNIFGSNAFNMILFVPLDFMYPKNLFSAVSSLHAVTAFCVAIAMGVAVMGQLYRKKERSRLTEPSSETVVIIIVLFLFLLYGLKT